MLLAAVFVLLAAAILLPSWFRSRMPQGDSPALADARTIASAELAYAGSNGGFYDEPRCLAKPASCIPGYPPDGAPFLYPELASLATRRGYARRFHPGPRPSADEIAKLKASPSSLRGYAYVLVPAPPLVPGSPAFCIDDTGVICWRLDGAMPDIRGGRCPTVAHPSPGGGQQLRPSDCLALQ
jgi:hypothetical protein